MTIQLNESLDTRKGVGARRIAHFLWSYWRRFPLVALTTLGLMLGSVVFDVLFPIVSGRLVDAVSKAGFPPGFRRFGVSCASYPCRVSDASPWCS